MVKTRTITTTTIKEYEDTVEGTILPSNTPESASAEEQRQTMTHPPDIADGIEDKEEATGIFNQQNFGRTWPDLLTEIKNDYRVILVVLLAGPSILAISLNRADSLDDLIFPFIVSIMLILTWFLSPLIVRLFRK